MMSGFVQLTGKCLKIMSIVASVTLLGLSATAEILNGPQDTEAITKETVKLHCKGTSDNIEWHHVPIGESHSNLVYQNGFTYDGYKERFKTERINDGECSLIINGVKPTDAGTFICLENSEAPLQVTAELIVFERVPSNEFCAGKYTCKPVCDALELSCEMKAHGNYIPSMKWFDSGGNSVDATSNMINGIIVSTFKIKSDPYRAVLFTCRIEYRKAQVKSKYSWTYSSSEPESSRQFENIRQQPPLEPSSPVTLVLIITCIMLATAFFIGIAIFLVMTKRLKDKQATTSEESAENLLKKGTDVEKNAAKVEFTPCTTANMGKPIHGLAAINDEVFIMTRDGGCVVEVFDLHSGRFKRCWSVDELHNPYDMAGCPTKKIIFITDWKNRAEGRKIFCLDIHGNQLCRWHSEVERGCISITSESNVIVANNWYSIIAEYTSTGSLINTIPFGKDKLHLWRAVKLNDGNYVACYGDAGDDHRGICILDDKGGVIHSTTSVSNLFLQKPLSVPKSLAVDKKGNIYICDMDNFRIIVLNSELKFKRILDTASDGYKLRGPLRVCCHNFNNRDWLLVADSVRDGRNWRNGRIAVLNLD